MRGLKKNRSGSLDQDRVMSGDGSDKKDDGTEEWARLYTQNRHQEAFGGADDLASLPCSIADHPRFDALARLLGQSHPVIPASLDQLPSIRISAL
jgi:hypothetical protein